ncbi:hypothetical protein HGRIS_012787 [Hohenbuehelia grisea]|uniref:Uncharacterized protein n=1 Tax=Hohenbuehelia grisea TaxID=104357 RepID=A0ABR3ITP0_9AGAR
MMPSVFQAISFASLLLTGVHAWGNEGHRAVGFIAMEFLAPKALDFVRSTLGKPYNGSLGPAATWADSVRRTPEYKWSGSWHFIDVEDKAPVSCGIVEARDCPSGCILTAIANYTNRVIDEDLSADQRLEALKFLTHFAGDIGQPLHAEGKEVGGNHILTKCGGLPMNLHAVWDVGIIKKHLKLNFADSSEAWIESLISGIQFGKYKSRTGEWLSCTSTTQLSRNSQAHEVDTTGTNAQTPITSNSLTFLECPLVWASDSNKYDCSAVFQFTSEDDLCDESSSYYAIAVDIIELQIAKQGYRLAAWLNALFDGEPYLP